MGGAAIAGLAIALYLLGYVLTAAFIYRFLLATGAEGGDVGYLQADAIVSSFFWPAVLPVFLALWIARRPELKARAEMAHRKAIADLERELFG